MPRYLTFVERVRPALEAAGEQYLARGLAHAAYEGNSEPARLVLMEFPSQKAWEYDFCFSWGYRRSVKMIPGSRQHCRRGRRRGIALHAAHLPS